MVGNGEQKIGTVAVACGAAGEFLDAATRSGSDAMVLGEARFHTCLEAEAWGIGLLLPGHFASERFAVEELAGLLAGNSLKSMSGPAIKNAIPWQLGRAFRPFLALAGIRPAIYPGLRQLKWLLIGDLLPAVGPVSGLLLLSHEAKSAFRNSWEGA